MSGLPPRPPGQEDPDALQSWAAESAPPTADSGFSVAAIGGGRGPSATSPSSNPSRPGSGASGKPSRPTSGASGRLSQPTTPGGSRPHAPLDRTVEQGEQASIPADCQLNVQHEYSLCSKRRLGWTFARGRKRYCKEGECGATCCAQLS